MDIVRSLSLPCGQCIGCRLERSRQWAVRCMHEASLYERNCFITLTYADDKLGYSLHYPDFQKFMKRLRARFACVRVNQSPNLHSPEDSARPLRGRGKRGGVKSAHPDISSPAPSGRVRFFMAGEYGEEFKRAHYHAILFNFDFPDKVYLCKSPSGSKIYRSPILEELWPYGFSSVGDVTFSSAAYVARYCTKKVTGEAAKQHYGLLGYEWQDGKRLPIWEKQPEFCHMSLKPGVGADWITRYRSDVYPHGKVVVNGVECKPPRFYDKRFEDWDGLEFEALQYSRYVEALARKADNTPERLAVKEKVQQARAKQLVRKIT